MLPLFVLALAAAEPPPAMQALMEKKPAAAEATVNAADYPAGAPTDDYGFVAWCHGALNGHMELYEQVKPQLAELERSAAEKAHSAQLDKEQMEAGKEYLALYSRALVAAERATPTAIHDRGVQADLQGYRMWAPARNADPKNRMWAWLTWELPGRCETVAKKLEERSSLFAETFRRGGPDEPVEAVKADAPTTKPDIGIPAEN
jgi:hypothetical protein